MNSFYTGSSYFGPDSGEGGSSSRDDRLRRLVSPIDDLNSPLLAELRGLAGAELQEFKRRFADPENITEDNARKFLDRIDMIGSHGDLLRNLWEFLFEIEHVLVGQGLADTWNAIIMTLGRHILTGQYATEESESVYGHFNLQKMHAYGIIGQRDKIEAAYRDALAYSRDEVDQDSGLLTRIEYLGAQVPFMASDVLRTTTIQGLELLEAAHRIHNQYAVLRAHVLLARIYHQLSNFGQSFTHSQQAHILGIHLDQPNTTLAMVCTMLSSIVYNNASSPYVDQLHAYVDVVRRNASRTIVSDAIYNGTVGYYLTQRGQHAEAIPYLRDAQTLYWKLGHPHNMTAVTNLLASNYAYIGELNLAEEWFQSVVDSYAVSDHKNRSPAQHVIALHGLGWVYLEKAKRELSIRYLSESLNLAKQLPESAWRASTIKANKEDLTRAKSLPPES
jgi:tetratricopeptide (TPR) repeat protein